VKRLWGALLFGILILHVVGKHSVLRAQSVIPRFESLGVNEGLSQSSIYSILQDRKGFMWFGTADGLNRFDGVSVRVFRVKAGNSKVPANSNFVRGDLKEDSKGRIWFSNETGIYFYDPLYEEIKLAHRLEGQLKNGIYAIAHIDADDRLWIVTLHDLVCFDTETGKIITYRFPFSIVEGFVPWTSTELNGALWFPILNKKGILGFDLKRREFQQKLDTYETLLIARGKRCNYFLSPYALYRYDSATQKLAPYGRASYQSLRSIIEDAYGRVWVGSLSNGLYLVQPDGKVILFQHDNSKVKSLPMNLITTLYIDRSNNLWVGTDGAGVARLDLKPPKFNLFPLNEGDYPVLSDYFTKCFYEEDEDYLWFGTHSNGVNVLNMRTGALQNYSAKSGNLQGNIVGAICHDRTGRIFVGHNFGISKFNKSKKTFEPLEIPSRFEFFDWQNFVYEIRETKKGDILAATNQGLLILRKGGDRFEDVGDENRVKWPFTSVQEDADGTLWVTSPLNGVLHLYPNGTGYEWRQTFFQGVDLRSIHFDEENDSIFWISSEKGLIRWNRFSKMSRVVDASHGMANNYVYGALEDAEHTIWVSTNGGLSEVDKKTLEVRNYSFADGLQSNEFNTSAFHKGKSGRLYFGGVKGFNWFSALPPRDSTSKPTTWITQFLVNAEPFQYDSGYLFHQDVSLPYSKNNLEFEFAALDFTRPNANKIAYKLENWDKTFITTTQRHVRYGNLPPGTYLLRYKASDSSGNWSNEKLVRIHIRAPFWLNIWFYSAVGVLAIVSIILVTKRYSQQRVKQQLRDLEKKTLVVLERLRISKDMHDEIGSGLTHIALLSELNASRARSADQMKKDITAISQTSQQLVQSMGEIIWAINPQNDTLENLLAYIREKTHAYFEPFSIRYTIEFPEQIPLIRLSNVQRRNLFLVTKESLNNALKHARASFIALKVTIDASQVVFTISDNGVGMGENPGTHLSNGLRNMKGRIYEINGTFEVVSSEGEGTHIVFSMPI